MASHKKTPLFLRIITNSKSVVCLNPLQLSSFQILDKAKIKTSKDEVIEAATIRFFFPSGTGLSYSVGIDLTQQEFDYVCSTLLEYVYLNEFEFKTKTALIEKDRMTEWNKISEENSKTLDQPPEAA